MCILSGIILLSIYLKGLLMSTPENTSYSFVDSNQYTNDLSELLDMGISLLESENYVQALQASQLALQQYPKDVSVLSFHINVLLHIYMFDEARKYIQKLLDIHPNNDYALSCFLKYLSNIPSKKDKIKHYINKVLHNKTMESYYAAAIGASNLGDIKQTIHFALLALKCLLNESCPHLKTNPAIDINSFLYKTHDIFTSLSLPCILAADTLREIWRDDTLSGSHIDLMLPYDIDRKQLVSNLKSHFYMYEYAEASINTAKNKLTFFIPPHGVCLNIYFHRAHNNYLLMENIMGKYSSYFQLSNFRAHAFQYAQRQFYIPDNTNTYLKEIYGNTWKHRHANYHFFILNEHLEDPHHIRIAYALKLILKLIFEGDIKEAHGVIMQLISIYDDSLLSDVAHYLQKNNENINWYPELPLKEVRIQKFEYH